MQEIYKKLKAQVNTNQIFINELMSKHTSFKIRWTSRFFCEGKKFK